MRTRSVMRRGTGEDMVPPPWLAADGEAKAPGAAPKVEPQRSAERIAHAHAGGSKRRLHVHCPQRSHEGRRKAQDRTVTSVTSARSEEQRKGRPARDHIRCGKHRYKTAKQSPRTARARRKTQKSCMV